MKYPDFLQENGKIGFIAPSFGCASLEPYHSRFKSALSFFENKGYSFEVGQNVYAEDGFGKSTTPEKCGMEINDFIINRRSDVIISVGGGETMCEDLPFVDFEKISASKPVWFMGYSDNTNLTFTLPTLCDIAAIYGPCASSFGMRPVHQYLTDSFDLLCGKKLTFTNYGKWEKESLSSPEDPTATLNAAEPFELSVFEGNRIYEKEKLTLNGRLIGGCLDLLCCLCGTSFDRVREFSEKYKEDGIIWFFEACDLNSVAVARALWQLRNAGWFENVKGFIFGRPLHFNENEFGLDCNEAARHALGDFDLPMIFNLDIGHLPPQMPIISGAIGNIEVNGNSVSVSYELR